MGWFDSEEEDNRTYTVVVNHEEQYSIWPEGRELPPGWRSDGTVGTKAECLAHIDAVWTDMRPLSLRKQMAEAAARAEEAPPPVDEEPEAPLDSLPERLAKGEHPVEVSLRPERTVNALKERIELGYVHIRFTETQGGTELGVRLDRDRSDLSSVNFEDGTGSARLEGTLTLDYVPVRCIANIDVATLAGSGHLVIERNEPTP